MSPVAMCGIPYSAEIRLACVPFPEPWGPKSKMFTGAPPGDTPRSAASPGGALSEEAFVGAHHHLRLHLAHRVERDTDDDEHRGAAEGARGRLREAAVADEEAWQHGYGRQVQRARQSQPRQHAVEVLRSRRAGPDAGDVPAVLAQVVGLVDRIELDRGVEVGEDDDQD